ncbi:MAG: hypothetical protein IMY73_02295 [Bacteroidetes bacterium]|nr:hypothetical protein [Bacteroidota bacterium]
MEITKEKISNWKAKYGEVFCYEVDGKIAYLKRPDRKTLSLSSVIGKEDPMKYNEVLLKYCWLGGDIEIQKEDKYFLGISSTLSELVEIKAGQLKKI